MSDCAPSRREALSAGPFLPEEFLPYNQIDQFARCVIVMTTNECPVMCAHCITHSGGVLRGHAGRDTIKNALRGAAAIEGVRVAIFSGGEPFVDPPALLEALKLAKSLGLETAALTSSHWAESDEIAERVLASLRPALDTLYLSVDLYHQRVVPLDWVRRVARAAAKLNLPGFVLNTVTTDELAESDAASPDALTISQEFDLPIHAWPMIAKGRGGRLGRLIPPVSADQPCGILTKPVVYPSGEVHACFSGAGEFQAGHPLHFGDVNKDGLPAIVERIGRSRLAQALRAFGPVALLRLLEEPADIYPRQCEACRSLCQRPDLLSRLESLLESRPELLQRIARHRNAGGDVKPEAHLAASS
jgi:hypothetical protein